MAKKHENTLEEVKAITSGLKYYFKHAKATHVDIGVYSGDINVYVFPNAVFHALLLHNNCAACSLDYRSSERIEFDGKKAVKHIRLNRMGVRDAILKTFDNMDTYGNPYYIKTVSMACIEAWEKSFCSEYNCVLKLKENGKHYTHGDSWECFRFHDIVGNHDNWSKNCRSYKHGTDCDTFEIKSIVWGNPALSPQINQYI